MNKHQEAKLEMLESAVSILEKGNGTAADLPVLHEKTLALRKLINQIREKTEIFNSVSVGKTLAKNQTKSSIKDLAIIAASGLYSYGRDTNDAEATERGNITESVFAKLREESVVTTVKNILEKVEEIGNALEKYGVSQQMIDDLRLGVDDYYQKLSTKSAGVAIRKSSRIAIAGLFRQADAELEATDRLMQRYAKSVPDFYTNYFSARPINDKSTVKRKPA